MELPKDVQWLLDFANLSCEQGKLNLQSLDIIPILNRPPVKPPETINTITTLPHTTHNTITDQAGNEWIQTWSDPVYLGKLKYPSRLEFETFFARNGADRYIEIVISSDQRGLFLFQDETTCSEMGYYYLKSFWVIARRALFSTIGGERGFNKHELQESIWRKYEELSGTFPSDIKGSVFEHDGTMPYVLYANILELQVNHEEYHSRLKACKYCGTFWIETGKVKRGKPRTMFCADECGVYFGRASREKDSETHIRANKVLRGSEKREIVEYLYKNRGEDGKQITKARAEEIYKALEQISPKTVSSLQQFLKSYHAHKPRVMLKALHHSDNKE